MSEHDQNDGAISKLEEGVNIAANGDVKINIRKAATTAGNGLNVVGVDSLEQIPEGAVIAITAAEWARIAAGVERRQNGKPASP